MKKFRTVIVIAFLFVLFTSCNNEKIEVQNCANIDNEVVFQGEYRAEDESTLIITPNGEQFDLIIDIIRLTFIEDGICDVLTGNSLEFIATDAAGNPICGKIRWVNSNDVILEFTDSTWSYLPNGYSIRFSRSNGLAGNLLCKFTQDDVWGEKVDRMEYVPYISVYNDGTFDFWCNCYSEMVMFSGTWVKNNSSYECTIKSFKDADNNDVQVNGIHSDIFAFFNIGADKFSIFYDDGYKWVFNATTGFGITCPGDALYINRNDTEVENKYVSFIKNSCTHNVSGLYKNDVTYGELLADKYFQESSWEHRLLNVDGKNVNYVIFKYISGENGNNLSSEYIFVCDNYCSEYSVIDIINNNGDSVIELIKKNHNWTIEEQVAWLTSRIEISAFNWVDEELIGDNVDYEYIKRRNGEAAAIDTLLNDTAKQ